MVKKVFFVARVQERWSFVSIVYLASRKELVSIMKFTRARVPWIIFIRIFRELHVFFLRVVLDIYLPLSIIILERFGCLC